MIACRKSSTRIQDAQDQPDRAGRISMTHPRLGLTQSPTGPQPMTSAVASCLSTSPNMSQAFLTTKQPVGKISNRVIERFPSHLILSISYPKPPYPKSQQLTGHQDQMPIRHPFRSFEQRSPRQRDPDVPRLSSFQLRTPDEGSFRTSPGLAAFAEPAAAARGREGTDYALADLKVGSGRRF